MVFWGVKTRVWWQVSTDRLSRDGSRVHIVHEFVSCRLSQVNSIIKASEALLQPNLQRLTKHTPCLLCHFNVVTRQSPPFLSYQPCLIELTRDTWMRKQICSIIKVIVASQMLWMVISEWGRQVIGLRLVAESLWTRHCDAVETDNQRVSMFRRKALSGSGCVPSLEVSLTLVSCCLYEWI